MMFVFIVAMLLQMNTKKKHILKFVEQIEEIKTSTKKFESTKEELNKIVDEYTVVSKTLKKIEDIRKQELYKEDTCIKELHHRLNERRKVFREKIYSGL